MRIIARKTLKVFWEKYQDAEQPLKAWYERVSEILNKQSKLNLRMIRNLHNYLSIPYQILAEDYTISKHS